MKPLHSGVEDDMIVSSNVKLVSVYIFMKNSKLFHEIYITIELERFTKPVNSQSESESKM